MGFLDTWRMDKRAEKTWPHWKKTTGGIQIVEYKEGMMGGWSVLKADINQGEDLDRLKTLLKQRAECDKFHQMDGRDWVGLFDWKDEPLTLLQKDEIQRVWDDNEDPEPFFAVINGDNPRWDPVQKKRALVLKEYDLCCEHDFDKAEGGRNGMKNCLTCLSYVACLQWCGFGDSYAKFWYKCCCCMPMPKQKYRAKVRSELKDMNETKLVRVD